MMAAGWEGSSRAVQASREGVTDLEASRIGQGQEEQEGRRGGGQRAGPTSYTVTRRGACLALPAPGGPSAPGSIRSAAIKS